MNPEPFLNDRERGLLPPYIVDKMDTGQSTSEGICEHQNKYRTFGSHFSVQTICCENGNPIGPSSDPDFTGECGRFVVMPCRNCAYLPNLIFRKTYDDWLNGGIGVYSIKENIITLICVSCAEYNPNSDEPGATIYLLEENSG